MARPFRIGATGGSTCSRKSDQSPHLGDGTYRSQCATGGTRSTTPEGVSGLRVRPNPTSTPEAIGDQQSSGGPLEKYQCTGALRSVSHFAEGERNRAFNLRVGGN